VVQGDLGRDGAEVSLERASPAERPERPAIVLEEGQEGGFDDGFRVVLGRRPEDAQERDRRGPPDRGAVPDEELLPGSGGPARAARDEFVFLGRRRAGDGRPP
jgi:hypothetical protein